VAVRKTRSGSGLRIKRHIRVLLHIAHQDGVNALIITSLHIVITVRVTAPLRRGERRNTSVRQSARIRAKLFFMESSIYKVDRNKTILRLISL
jgi:hypothetical protein